GALDARDGGGEVADEAEPGAPEQSADDVAGEEPVVVHAPHARDNGNNDASEWYEAGDDYRPPAVTLVEPLRPVDGVTDAPALPLFEVRTSSVPPNEEADLVSQERRQPDSHRKHDDVEVGVRGGDEPRRKEEGVAGDEGDEDPEKQCGSGEDEREDDRVEEKRPDAVEEVDHVLAKAEAENLSREHEKPI